MSFAFLALTVTCCFYIVLVQQRTGPTWLISPPVLMTAYFLLVNLPGIWLVSDPYVREKVLLGHLLWMLGVLLSCFVFGEWTIPNTAGIAPERFYRSSISAFYLFILLGVAAFLITFALFGRAPLLIAINSLLGSGGDGLTMHQARQMNTLENRNGDTVYFGAGYLKQIYTVISPVFCSALYLHYRLRLRQKAPLAVKFFMLFFVVAGAMNGQIWVSAFIIILFLLMKYMADILSKPDFNATKLMRNGIIAYIALLVFVFAYRYLQYLQGRYFQDFYGDTVSRIYSYSQANLFVLFGELMPHRYGSTWINDFKGVLPGSIQSFSYEVDYLINGTQGFTLAPGIVASSYVNFGYIGVAVTGFVLTAVFTPLYNRLLRSRDILSIALGVYVSFVFFSGLPGDLNSYLVSLLTVFAIYLMYHAVNMVLDMRESRVIEQHG